MGDAFHLPDDWNRFANISSELSELSTNKERVAHVLNRFPETRNSDKELWITYLQVFHGVDPQSAPLASVTSSEYPAQTVVSRARAELQNRYQLYLPTRPEVLVKRQGRRKAFEKIFLQLETLGDEDQTETVIYSDESGITEDYLIFAFVLFLRAQDNFQLTSQAFEWDRERNSGRRFYYHFKELRSSGLPRYREFIDYALNLPTIRAYVHIFERARLLGPQSDVLFNSYSVAAVRTIRELQRRGIIDAGRHVRLAPDQGQDQLFYSNLENVLDTQFAERQVNLRAVEPTPSRESYPVQAADLLASSFGRILNSTGGETHVKDTFAAHVLSALRVSEPSVTGEYGHVTVINHGSPVVPRPSVASH